MSEADDKVFDIMNEVAISHLVRLGAQADHLARLLNGLIEGDDPEEAANALIDYGYCDEDGFWVGYDSGLDND
jgi:hypothetical protein